MSNELELDASTHEAIKALCAEGDRLAEVKSYEAAVAEYNKAWALVPEPKNEWQASTWILAAIADACFLSGYKTSALKALQFAMTCPGAVGNPFLHLRLGQVLLDSGDEDSAADELMRAYMGGGPEIFASEEGRYLDFLKTRARL
ncbi:tetratricopeptide repeat protein [Ralstonia pseudosolanacearum]